jgi:hypothetical protein
MYKLNGVEVSYNRFYDNAREFTPEQLVEAANDALENWEWPQDNRVGDHNLLKSFLEGWTVEFAENFANDYGVIQLGRSYKDVWEWLDEFCISSYNSYVANMEYWE